jgi:hypothetical protein
MILLVSLVLVVSINGYLAYRYYDRLDDIRNASADTIPSDSTSEQKPDSGKTSEARKASEPEETSGSDPKPEKKTEPEPDNSFVHRAEPQNVLANSTYIDRPRSNGNPEAILLAEPSRSGDEVDYAHLIGVWYDSGRQRWAIFNQDIARMREGSTFDVTIVEESSGGSGPAGGYGAVFVHRATTINIAGSATYIDHPSVNGNPDSSVSITPNWNPGGNGGTYNDHPVDLSYDPDRERWMIANQDNAQMPVGAAFNVAVSDDASAE